MNESPASNDEQHHGSITPAVATSFEEDDDDEIANDYWGRRAEMAVCLVYLIIVILVFEAGVITLEPTDRPIPFQLLDSTGDYIRNLVLNEDYEGETIPDWLLIVIGIVLPLTIQHIVSFLLFRTKKNPDDPLRAVRERHNIWCVYLTTVATNLLMTDALKVYCGYLRPVFYEWCQANDTYDECLQEDESLERDARKSFPSGHASISFSGLILLTLYLNQRCGTGALVVQQQQQQQQQQSQQTTTTTSQYLKTIRIARIISIVAWLPMLVAVFIAASRVYDREHHPADIVGGAVLGSSIGYYLHANVWFYE